MQRHAEMLHAASMPHAGMDDVCVKMVIKGMENNVVKVSRARASMLKCEYMKP